MASLVKAYWWLGVGVIWVLVADRVEPFRSHFWLRQLSTLAVAFALGAIHLAIRNRAIRSR
jgi:hypothetical protein